MRLLSSVLPFIILIASDGIIPVIPQIRIDDAIYASGKLTVTGEAKAGQQISLNSRYTTKADQDGMFRFVIDYLPQNCIITLASGDRSRVAVVRGCDVAVGAVPTSPPQPTPPPTPKPKHP